MLVSTYFCCPSACVMIEEFHAFLPPTPPLLIVPAKHISPMREMQRNEGRLSQPSALSILDELRCGTAGRQDPP